MQTKKTHCDLSLTFFNSEKKISSNPDINIIRYFLSEFSETKDLFSKWKKQIKIIQRTHNLDGKTIKLLIGVKLKEELLNWFCYKINHLEKFSTDFFEQIAVIFVHRPSMLSWRQDFKQCMWYSSETFHDSTILVRHLPVDHTKTVSCLTEVIFNERLRNQLRLQDVRIKSELLMMFQKISLPPKNKKHLESTFEDKRNREPSCQAASSRNYRLRCFNCFQSDHRTIDCPLSNWTNRSCSECKSIKHRNRDCLNKPPTSNLVQTFLTVAPYELSVTYDTTDDNGVCTSFNIMALLDSGSPVSLIKEQCVPRNSRLPISSEDYDLCGINGSKVAVLSLFQGNISVNSVHVNLSFLIVPDNTMSFDALLGRDFISDPSLEVKMGQTVEVKRVSLQNETTDAVREILNIDIRCESDDISAELNINPRINPKIFTEVKNMYESVLNMKIAPASIDFEMHIRLQHNCPIAFHPKQLNFSDQKKLQAILDRLKNKGVIRVSDSAYASPMVLVRKKSGEFRLNVNFCEINKITDNDHASALVIEDHLSRLKNKRYFTKLNLTNEFYNIKMAESSIKYTSFITPIGQFEYLKMPFGLTNGPCTFRKLIHKIFRPLVEENKISLYMDDILIATNSMDEHLQILYEVFYLARKYQLKFRLDKCSFLYTEINFLGYLINIEGIRPNGKYVDVVVHYPIPRTVQQVQQFISFASYFSRFIPDFSCITKPLYDVIKTDNFKFGADQYKAFHWLKNCLVIHPVLMIYTPILPIELHCVANTSGFGAILMQKQDSERLQPIAYFSRRMTSTESKYQSFELKCQAVVYAIKRFHIFLFGLHFKIVMDFDNFRLTLAKKTVNPRISRWAILLQLYSFEVEHRPANQMRHVDALSRCHSAMMLESNTFEKVLAIKQHQDIEIRAIRKRLKKGEEKAFELHYDLVYKKLKHGKLLFYVPREMESNVICTGHDDLGHVDVDKVLENLTRTYWFPKMREKIKLYIGNCLKCIEFSPLSRKQEDYLNNVLEGTVPFDTIHLQHYGPLEKSKRGNKYILSVVDAFTKYIRLFPCKSMKSEETIRHVCDYFQAYSRPRRIITDRGTLFTSKTFREFVEAESVIHALAIDDTSCANSQVERFNRDFIPMLAKLSKSPDKWDEVLCKVEFALNNTICCPSGETPSMLLFGVSQVGEVNDRVQQILGDRCARDRDICKTRERAIERIKLSQQNSERCYNL